MIELATADAPGVLLLQEVPVWSLARLEEWSGMRAYPARRARAPHRPSALAVWLTRQHTGLFRSRLGGQAIAVLVDRDRSERGPRRSRGERTGPRAPGRAGGADRRISVSSRTPTSRRCRFRSQRARRELERVRAFVERVARARRGARDRRRPQPRPARARRLPGRRRRGSTTSSSQASAAAPLQVWPPQRRVQNGVVLSDHAPVERLLG